MDPSLFLLILVLKNPLRHFQLGISRSLFNFFTEESSSNINASEASRSELALRRGKLFIGSVDKMHKKALVYHQQTNHIVSVYNDVMA